MTSRCYWPTQYAFHKPGSTRGELTGLRRGWRIGSVPRSRRRWPPARTSSSASLPRPSALRGRCSRRRPVRRRRGPVSSVAGEDASVPRRAIGSASVEEGGRREDGAEGGRGSDVARLRAAAATSPASRRRRAGLRQARAPRARFPRQTAATIGPDSGARGRMLALACGNSKVTGGVLSRRAPTGSLRGHAAMARLHCEVLRTEGRATTFTRNRHCPLRLG